MKPRLREVVARRDNSPRGLTASRVAAALRAGCVGKPWSLRRALLLDLRPEVSGPTGGGVAGTPGQNSGLGELRRRSHEDGMTVFE